ncbi:hypothetical protein V6Z11_D09G037800 [Gossypium hirsutum]
MPISLSSSPSYPILNLKTRLHSPLYPTTVKRHRLWSPTPTRNYNADFQEILPGKYSGHLGAVQARGSWWNLPGVQASESSTAKPVTVSMALKRIWGLIGDDNWIVFLALGALFIAAVSKISMPRILAASVFSANSGESAAFFRSSRMLILLLIISGICSGLRSGCFAMPNTILVKRLRRSLYASLVFQYLCPTLLSDTYPNMGIVGSLTSRLGSDCQRLSYVIGNDIHLIIRNAIQGTGALINLLTLSWPLTLPTLIICSVLAIIFSIYGRYQKRAAKLMQEFNACANNVAQETLSLMRTVRAYGTEGEEVERYKRWLDELAFVSIRESAAYGLWSTSFLTLYRFTQVLAVLLGGICIMNSQLSPEQLTKYILYCEWLIYATWRVVDNSSSLLQSIGACEKVFHLMDLLPTDQFLSKGVKLPRLMGNIQFVNVSFHYPSRISAGLSGSGKSTIVNLLLRLYQPVSGQIYMDGLPLDELDIRWLRENIGFVGQSGTRFV